MQLSSNDFISYAHVKCHCNEKAICRKAITSANYGRRFYGCLNYARNNFCGFFVWIDAPCDSNEEDWIQGLVKDKIAQEKKISNVEAALKAKDMELVNHLSRSRDHILCL